MDIVRNAQKRLRPHPFLYRLFTYIYVVYGEVAFFFHALFAGKLLSRVRRDPFPGLVSQQAIVSYPLRDVACSTNDRFREWLKEEDFQFQEGRWTFYIPPQGSLQRHFGFVTESYPPNAGLKILKDFRHPDSARYTRHMQSPAPGAALKRLLTPSPKALVRVANYLYSHCLGVRLYDLIALEGRDRTLSAYVVEHLQGDPVTPVQYESFMDRMRGLLGRNEITTVHENVDIMADFAPPDCSSNLIMSTKDGKPLYVDFQGFLFRDEKRYIQTILLRSFSQRDTENQWRNIREMMKAVGFSLQGRVTYDIGCNIEFLYYALSEGGQWVLGWGLPEVIASANRVLLALGATRFDLFERVIDQNTAFKSDIPARFKKERRGVLFYFAGGREGLPYGVSEIPWEYMIFEGDEGKNIEEYLKRVRDVSWLRNAEVLTHRSFSCGDSQTRVLILLRHQACGIT